FNKDGGNLGESGCVSYKFDRKGYLAIDRSEHDVDEDELLLDVIEAGGDEVEKSDEAFEVYTAPEAFMEVKTALEESGIVFASAEVTMVPQTTRHVDDEQAAKIEKMLDMLEDDDDFQDVYHNFEA